VTAAVGDVAERIVAGVPAAIARGISWCESGGEQGERLLERLPARAAHVVGLTGSPGAGKSTLVNRLVRGYRAQGATVAVVAVDPSSPITGGALLGDRVRMDSTVGDRGVFFRSLASRGAAGGISDATRAATQVLSAGGFDVVLVETVGAGQAEVAIMRVADTVALVLQPGAGDEVQALKAGLMEIADVYVLNKADQDGIRALKSQIRSAIGLRPPAEWKTPMVETSARQGTGVDDLIDALRRHRDFLRAGATGADRATEGAHAEALRLARAELGAAIAAEQADVLARLDAGELGEADAARELALRAARRVVEGLD
jgi:LAO/AO transport system kinase